MFHMLLKSKPYGKISVNSTSHLKYVSRQYLAYQSHGLFKTKLNTIQPTKQHVRTALRSGGGYSNYGHGRNTISASNFGKFYHIFLMALFFVTLFVNIESLFAKTPDESERHGKIDAESVEQSIVIDDKKKKTKKAKKQQKTPIDIDASEQDDVSPTKSHLSFKDKKIIEYENRIRFYSTPDKIFRYFATLKVWNEVINDYEIYMKPEDFVRSLTYNAKQPDNLGLDSFLRYEPNMHNIEMNLPEDSVFYHLGQDGLISFSDYLFLLTLLSTPTRHFEIAFKMFDLDGNGNIDIDEYEQLQEIIRKNSYVGQKHRDTRINRSILKVNSALNQYFFGESSKELLTVEKFIKFQKQLQSEIVKMEFERNDSVNGKISDLDFCKTLILYAGLNEAKTKKMLKRVSKQFDDSEQTGITFKEFEDFFQVLRSIQDIDIALKFYYLAGTSIDQSVFKHVAKTVSNVVLSDHLVKVVFCLFDDDGDGKLSHNEFISLMKKRWLRGLQNPKDTGFVRFMDAFYTCSKETVKARYFS